MIALACTLQLAAQATASPTTPATTPPNFVVILTDDQTWVGSSLQMLPDNAHSKSDYYQTPHIERLAEMGMVFSQGYAPASACHQTRRALQTGQTTARHVYHRDRDNWSAIYRKQLTIPRMLKATDPRYRTAHFGKWDMRYDKPTPEDMGYDVSDGYTGNYTARRKNRNGPAAVDDPKLIQKVTQRAINFVREQHESGNPFYVQLSHYAVHLKIQYREETLARTKQWPTGSKHNLPEFAAMTADLDDGIGKLLDSLEALGLAQNTFIFFLSDNGGRLEIREQENRELPRNYPLRGAKGDLYEGGIRVPFIVAGPGVGGRTASTTAVTGLDILPTIAELAGYTHALPAQVDGGSLVPVLTNAGAGKVSRNRDFLFFHQAIEEPLISALISGNYKLVRTGEFGLELFDLSNDLGEKTNLKDRLPRKAAELLSTMNRFLLETGADTSAPKGKEKKRKKTKSPDSAPG